MKAGTTGTAQVEVHRAGHAGEITIAVTAPEGLTVTVSPTPGEARTGEIIVTATETLGITETVMTVPVIVTLDGMTAQENLRVKVPPIEMLTNSTPSAPYFSRSGMPGRNTSGLSIRAATVIAAGSVIRDPIAGNSARQSQTCASAARSGKRLAIEASKASILLTTGREAAITMTTKTNSGSVYWRDSA